MSLRILLLCTAFNGLSQRAWCELRDQGHELEVLAGGDGDAMRAVVARFAPNLIVAPMLKSAIPEDIWRRQVCLIVHPRASSATAAPRRWTGRCWKASANGA